MKLLLLLPLVFTFFTSPASADDGGVVGIAVKDLSVTKVSYPDSGVRHDPVPQPNYEIKLTGGEAAKLLRILPSQLYVITGMYPKFAPTYNANFKALEITGGKTQPTVTIACQGGTLKESPAPSFTPFKDGAHCTIEIEPVVAQDDNIEYTFNPAKDICHQ